MLDSKDVKTKMLAVVVTPDFHARVVEECEKHNIKMSTFLRNAIEKEFNKLYRGKL